MSLRLPRILPTCASHELLLLFAGLQASRGFFGRGQRWIWTIAHARNVICWASDHIASTPRSSPRRGRQVPGFLRHARENALLASDPKSADAFFLAHYVRSFTILRRDKAHMGLRPPPVARLGVTEVAEFRTSERRRLHSIAHTCGFGGWWSWATQIPLGSYPTRAACCADLRDHAVRTDEAARGQSLSRRCGGKGNSSNSDQLDHWFPPTVGDVWRLSIAAFDDIFGEAVGSTGSSIAALASSIEAYLPSSLYLAFWVEDSSLPA